MHFYFEFSSINQLRYHSCTVYTGERLRDERPKIEFRPNDRYVRDPGETHLWSIMVILKVSSAVSVAMRWAYFHYLAQFVECVHCATGVWLITGVGKSEPSIHHIEYIIMKLIPWRLEKALETSQFRFILVWLIQFNLLNKTKLLYVKCYKMHVVRYCLPLIEKFGARFTFATPFSYILAHICVRTSRLLVCIISLHMFAIAHWHR